MSPKANKQAHFEELLDKQFKAAGIDGYERGFKFSPKHQYKADFFFPLRQLIVEVDGGLARGAHGAHTSYSGYTADRVRDIIALMLGFTTVRVTTHMVRDGEAIEWLKQLLLD